MVKNNLLLPIQKHPLNLSNFSQVGIYFTLMAITCLKNPPNGLLQGEQVREKLLPMKRSGKDVFICFFHLKTKIL